MVATLDCVKLLRCANNVNPSLVASLSEVLQVEDWHYRNSVSPQHKHTSNWAVYFCVAIRAAGCIGLSPSDCRRGRQHHIDQILEPYGSVLNKSGSANSIFSSRCSKSTLETPLLDEYQYVSYNLASL